MSFNYQKAREVPAFTPTASQPVAPLGRVPARRGTLSGVPQVHRMLALPEHLAVIRDREENRRSCRAAVIIRYAELDIHPNDSLSRKRRVQDSEGLG